MLADVSNLLKDLFRLDPGPWQWRLGMEACAATSLALGAWTVAGLQSFGLIASLGVFAIHGVAWSRAGRGVGVALYGAGLVIASAIGVACSTSTAMSMVGLTLITASATAATLLFRLGPPGPLMFVLVCGVSGYVAGHVRGAVGPLTPALIPVLVASGVLITWLVAAVSLLWSSGLDALGALRNERTSLRCLELSVEEELIGVRVIVGAAVASVLGAQLGIQRVFWVVVPAVAILQRSHSSLITTSRALHKILGTAMGLGIFVLTHRVLPAGWAMIVTIAMFQGLVELVIARNYALALVFVTPMALTISTVGNPVDAHVLVGERMVDTLLGTGTALAVLSVSNLIEWRRADRIASASDEK